MSSRTSPVVAALVAIVVARVTAGCASVNQTLTRGWQQAQQGRATLALDARERWLLGQLFGATLRADQVVLVYDSPVAAGAPRTIQSRIHLQRAVDVTQPATRRSAVFIRHLAHEGTHVWQYQNVGLLYVADSLFQQGKGVIAHGDRNRAYQYVLDPRRRFNSYNSEQQAQLIEDFVMLWLYGATPAYCDNWAALGGRAGFLRAAAQLVARDLNRGFRLLDGAQARAIIEGSRGR